MDILGRIPHFSVKRMQALMDRGLVRPLMSDCYDEADDDEVEAKSVVISTTADRWYNDNDNDNEFYFPIFTSQSTVQYIHIHTIHIHVHIYTLFE